MKERDAPPLLGEDDGVAREREETKNLIDRGNSEVGKSVRITY